MPSTAPFTAEAMKVGQLLANPFVIEAPSYQRSFAWGDKEASKLLEDITSVPQSAELRSGQYFLGAMLFIKRDKPTSRLRGWPRATRTLEVVDGLQRLTTLTILFCVLRDLDEGDCSPRVLAAITAGHGANARHRLSIGGPDERFFLEHVRAPGATRVKPESTDLSPAQVRILEVRDHFVTALTGYEAADRQKLAEFLLDRCHVVQVGATDIDQAHHMFEVLNARGKPLARNDILKAALLGRVPPEAEASATATWEEAEGRLGEQFEQLFSHIRTMYGRLDEPVIAGIIGIAREEGGAQAFIERILRPAAGILDHIGRAECEGQPQSATVGQLLRYLGWHSFSDWIPPAMLGWLVKGEDAQALAAFLKKLDRLTFGIRIMGIGGSKRTRRFGAVVAAIRGGRGLDDADSPLQFSRSELKTIQHNLRDLHARNAPAAKHLLLRLSDQMAGTPQSLALLDVMTVEHVLPKKLAANSQWRGWHADPNEREQCTESLGNLVLVTKAQNDRAANLELGRKLDIYFNTRGAPVAAINEDLRGRTEWKGADIRAREAQLMRLIEEVWDFGLPKLHEPTPEPTPTKPKAKRGRKRG